MSGNTFNELTDTLKELEYNGAAHYLGEFMQLEGCKVIVNNQIGDGSFLRVEWWDLRGGFSGERTPGSYSQLRLENHQNLFFGNRLVEVMGYAQFFCLLYVLAVPRTGKYDDSGLRLIHATQLPALFDKLKTIHHGHVEIQEDVLGIPATVGLGAHQVIERLLSVSGKRDAFNHV